MFPNPKFPGMFLAVPSEKQGDVQLIPVVGPLQFPFLSSMLAQSIGKMRPQAGEEPQDRNVDGAAGGVVEVDTQAGFQEACLSQRKLCVIAFLDTSKVALPLNPDSLPRLVFPSAHDADNSPLPPRTGQPRGAVECG